MIEGGLACTNEATDIDHIIAGDDHSLSNLAPICSGHHKRKTHSESFAAYMKKKRQTNFRVRREFFPEEPLPGSSPKEPFKHPWQRREHG